MRRHLPALLAALIASGVVIGGLDVPLVEDSLFWWVPKALLVAERGPLLVLDELALATRPHAPLPPQWEGGLPDYGHPPLWFWYLGLWLRLLGPTHEVVHLAALPLAAGMGVGLVAVARRLGGQPAAWAAVALPLLPPVVAQLQRADTDLPLMALTPWALWGLLSRREGVYALAAGLATACKEPGVLLAAPGLVAALMDRRLGWGWLWPPMVLAGWGALHHAEAGWALAGTERLPETAGVWLRDVGAVLRIVLLEQGRWMLIPLGAWAVMRGRRVQRRGMILVATHLAVQLAFFGTLNFLGGIDRTDAHTHVRYLLPAVLSAGLIGVALQPLASAPLVIVSALTLHQPSDDGPEASLYGTDVARALRAAVPRIEGLDGPVWVGSYAWTQLTRPYAGVVDTPMDQLHLYHYGVDPAEVEGWVVEAAEGEPLGRLQELELEDHREFLAGEAWVRIYEVRGLKPDQAPGQGVRPP